MTHDKGNTRDGVTGDGVNSSSASDLTDRRGGARDTGKAGGPVTNTPEGLTRERKGPYSPTKGRGK